MSKKKLVYDNPSKFTYGNQKIHKLKQEKPVVYANSNKNKLKLNHLNKLIKHMEIINEVNKLEKNLDKNLEYNSKENLKTDLQNVPRGTFLKDNLKIVNKKPTTRMFADGKIRCTWCNESEIMLKYHDTEWCKPKHNDIELFEALCLEIFQAGLSWSIILSKRDEYSKLFANFDPKVVAKFGEEEVANMLENPVILRNKLKLSSAVFNAKIFVKIQQEFSTFDNYIWSFTNRKTIIRREDELIAENELSKKIANDLKKRGMKFIGSKLVYAYLQAIGVINDHSKNCWLGK